MLTIDDRSSKVYYNHVFFSFWMIQGRWVRVEYQNAPAYEFYYDSNDSVIGPEREETRP